MGTQEYTAIDVTHTFTVIPNVTTYNFVVIGGGGGSGSSSTGGGDLLLPPLILILPKIYP
jgi:hypothetical protein